MDHVICMDSRAREMQDLVNGKKSMILRGGDIRELLYGNVNKGDRLYFVNNTGEGVVKARGTVSYVFCSDRLSVEESFELIIRNQDKLQLPDEQFERLAGRRYLILIGIINAEEIEPITIDSSVFTNPDDWRAVLLSSLTKHSIF